MAQAEVLPPSESVSALDLVASGATIMRVENETMSAVAVQRPRQEKMILKDALDELEIVPKLATRCYYSIPYEDKRAEKTVYVTGSSIHAARNLMRRWGNCSAKTILTGEDDDKVLLSGVFIDLQTNVRIERIFTVTKWQHRRGGAAYRLSNERLTMAIQAGASKAERNAIIAGLPDWLVQSYFDKARAIAARETGDAPTSKILEAFLAEGVSRDELEAHLGKPMEKLSQDDVANLRGLLNAIRDGEVKAADVFGRPADTTPKPQENVIDDIMAGAKATVTGGHEAQSPRAETAPPEPPAAEKQEPPAPSSGVTGEESQKSFTGF